MQDSIDLHRRVALSLFECGVVRFGAFRLKHHETDPEAPLSPIYLDLRIVRSLPELLGDIVDLLEGYLQSFEFDILADVPTAATPFVSALAFKQGLPFVTPRLTTKEHGIETTVEGLHNADQRVLVIDDLITQAESKLEAVKALEDKGLKVVGVLVLVDREQGGIERLAKEGYHAVAIYRLTNLLELYVHSKLITEAQRADTLAYLEIDRRN